MPDYAKGKIYKILNNVDDEVYVGSTIETLSQRMSRHRRLVITRPQIQIYQHMTLVGADNFYIELIENYNCSCIEELRAREGYHIRQIGTLNKNIAGRSKNEYAMDTQEQFKAYQHQWYLNNRTRIIEKSKASYQEKLKIDNEHLTDS